jgi:hypothetical protein
LGGYLKDSQSTYHGWLLQNWHFIRLDAPGGGHAPHQGTVVYAISPDGSTAVGTYFAAGPDHGFVVRLR